MVGMSAHHIYILTGGSRGMGAALAQRLLRPGHRLVCISRHSNDALEALADEHHVPLEQWAMDLSDPAEPAIRVEAWLRATAPEDAASATLINNAGVLSRLGPVQDADNPDLARAIRVGLEAPVLLCAAFLRATEGWTAPRRILNVSSGLGRRAMAGSATYCAAKAGLDHYSRAVALDEARKPHGARICSLAPGVIDTGMQQQLREGDPARFPDGHNFIALKENGRLWSPAQAASHLLAYLERPDFGAEPVADVRT